MTCLFCTDDGQWLGKNSFTTSMQCFKRHYSLPSAMPQGTCTKLQCDINENGLIIAQQRQVGFFQSNLRTDELCYMKCLESNCSVSVGSAFLQLRLVVVCCVLGYDCSALCITIANTVVVWHFMFSKHNTVLHGFHECCLLII